MYDAAAKRSSGTLAGPIREIQPYQVTGERCYADDCALGKGS
jgi:hypothetical protein